MGNILSRGTLINGEHFASYISGKRYLDSWGCYREFLKFEKRVQISGDLYVPKGFSKHQKGVHASSCLTICAICECLEENLKQGGSYPTKQGLDLMDALIYQLNILFTVCKRFASNTWSFRLNLVLFAASVGLAKVFNRCRSRIPAEHIQQYKATSIERSVNVDKIREVMENFAGLQPVSSPGEFELILETLATDVLSSLQELMQPSSDDAKVVFQLHQSPGDISLLSHCMAYAFEMLYTQYTGGSAERVSKNDFVIYEEDFWDSPRTELEVTRNFNELTNIRHIQVPEELKSVFQPSNLWPVAREREEKPVKFNLLNQVIAGASYNFEDSFGFLQERSPDFGTRLSRWEKLMFIPPILQNPTFA